MSDQSLPAEAVDKLFDEMQQELHALVDAPDVASVKAHQQRLAELMGEIQLVLRNALGLTPQKLENESVQTAG